MSAPVGPLLKVEYRLMLLETEVLCDNQQSPNNLISKYMCVQRRILKLHFAAPNSTVVARDERYVHLVQPRSFQ